MSKRLYECDSHRAIASRRLFEEHAVEIVAVVGLLLFVAVVLRIVADISFETVVFGWISLPIWLSIMVIQLTEMLVA